MAQVELVVKQPTGRILNFDDEKTTIVIANTYIFPNNGKVRLLLDNTAVTAAVATVVTPLTQDGNAVANPTYSTPASERAVLGPWPKDIYNNSNGILELSFDAICDVMAFKD